MTGKEQVRVAAPYAERKKKRNTSLSSPGKHLLVKRLSPHSACPADGLYA